MSVWIAATSPASGRGGRPRRRGAVLCRDERCGRETPRAAATALTGRPPATRSRARAPFWGRSRAPPPRAGSRSRASAELAKRLIEVSETADDGEPKTGRRFYYLALSRGYIRPDMSDSDTGKRSRNAAYKRVTDVLGALRMNGGLPWRAVLDLTRELTEWQTFDSSRDARAYLRRVYTEDQWIGQLYRPLLIVEKDTMEPVCRP